MKHGLAVDLNFPIADSVIGIIKFIYFKACLLKARGTPIILIASALLHIGISTAHIITVTLQ